MWKRIKSKEIQIMIRHILSGIFVGVVLYQTITYLLSGQRIDIQFMNDSLGMLFSLLAGAMAGGFVWLAMVPKNEKNEEQMRLKIKQKGKLWYILIFMLAFSVAGLAHVIFSAFSDNMEDGKTVLTREFAIRCIATIIAWAAFSVFWSTANLKRLLKF
jgi:hypothetical protein